MIKKKIFLTSILLIFLSSVSSANYLNDHSSDMDGLNSKTLSASRNLETGILNENYSTDHDHSSSSILYHFNSNLLTFSSISSFEFIYALKKDFGWLNFSIAKLAARFDQVTTNNPALGAFDQDLNEEFMDILSFGLGLSYKTQYIRHLFRFNSLYETIGASLTYNQVNENFRKETFTGGGMKADFGIHTRFSKNFHFGGKMSYNLLHTRRPLDFEGQASSSRSLLLSWTTFGLDFTFYY